MKRLLLLAACVLALAGCETIDPDAPAKAAMNEAIKAEAPGDYFVGRRMYKKDYKVWGWVRQPGQNWKSAKLVMLNEQKLLAPDRAKNEIGSDNNYEYTLKGYYSERLSTSRRAIAFIQSSSSRASTCARRTRRSSTPRNARTIPPCASSWRRKFRFSRETSGRGARRSR